MLKRYLTCNEADASNYDVSVETDDVTALDLISADIDRGEVWAWFTDSDNLRRINLKKGHVRIKPKGQSDVDYDASLIDTDLPSPQAFTG